MALELWYFGFGKVLEIFLKDFVQTLNIAYISFVYPSSFSMISGSITMRGHPHRTYAKFSEILTSLPLPSTQKCAVWMTQNLHTHIQS